MFCPNCDSQVSNGAAFCEKCGVQFKASPVAKKRSSGGGGGGGSRGGAAPPSYLVLSILATMLLPTGIVAIIKSTQVGGAIARGDYNAAQDASSAAMKWCVISFVLAALYLLFSMITIVTQAEAGGGAGV